MALTMLKKTPIHCVAMITGTGAQTIALATDLLCTNETAGTCQVNIAGIYWAIPGATPATIVRNSVTHWNLVGSYKFEFRGWNDSLDNTSDIIVTLPANATVVVELVKVGGYGNEQQRKSVGGDLYL